MKSYSAASKRHPAGYQLQELMYEGEQSRLFRGVRESDGLPVILKGPNAGFDLPALKALNNEWDLHSRIPRGIAPECLQWLDDGPFLVKRYHEGSTLGETLPPTGLDLAEWFTLADQLFTLLEKLQGAGIVHGDIRPSNIFLAATGEMLLLDFGHAFILQPAEEELQHLSPRGGSPLYISPEQTGRIKQPVDFRSDYYCAGLCLYEALTGTPPFGGNMLEILHGHMASRPESPSQIDSTIPEPVSALVLKLLEKLPEDRYFSAEGVRNDLSELQALLAGEEVSGTFQPGRSDPAAFFSLSNKLVSREGELSSLHEAILRTGEGGAELLLLAGESGLGKSALLREFARREQGEEQPFWVVYVSWEDEPDSGQNHRGALLRAAEDLVFRILGAHEKETASWASMIRSELGESVALLGQHLPALSMIIGAPGEAEECSDGSCHDSMRVGEGRPDGGRRLEHALISFLGLFSSWGEGLVLVLDDLHLADREELQMLRSLLALEVKHPLLVVTSYQPEAVGEEGRVLEILAQLPSELPVSTMLLRGLSAADIARWLQRSFGADEEMYHHQAELLEEKFGGNPFYIRRAVRYLYQEGSLFYRKGSGWVWKEEAVKTLAGVTSLRLLIFHHLDQLSAAERRLLASLLSLNQGVSRETLTKMCGDDFSFSGLQKLERLGFVIQAGKGVEALGGKVRRRLLQEFPPSLLEAIRQKMGRYLLRQLSDASLTASDVRNVMDQLGDLMPGLPFSLFDEDERRQLAQVCITQGEEQLEEEHYDRALQFTDWADLLCPDFRAESDGEMPVRYLTLRARSLFLQGSYEPALKEYYTLVDFCKEPELVMAYYGEMIEACSLLSRFHEALEVGERAFSLAGIDFLNSREGRSRELDLILASLVPEDVKRLSQPESVLYRQFVKAAVNLDGAIYSQRPEGYGNFIKELMVFILDHGGGAESSFIFSLYALYLAGREYQFEKAEAFGRAALRLSDQYSDNRYRIMCREVYSSHVAPWTTPLVDIDPLFSEGIKLGRSSGEMQFTGYLYMHRIVHEWFLATDYEEVRHRCEEYGRIVRSMRNQEAVDHIEGIGMVLSLFMADHTEELERLLIKLDRSLKETGERGNYQALVSAWGFLLLYSCILDDTALAERALQVVERYFLHLKETYLVAPVALARGLLALERGDTAEAGEMAELLSLYSSGCDENFRHLGTLLQAELIISGEEPSASASTGGEDTAEAEILFEEALDAARQGGDLFHTALINERFGLFQVRLGRKRIGGLYLQEAYRYWSYLGVPEKASRLRQRWGSLFPGALPLGETPQGASGGTERGALFGVDVISLLKAGRELTSTLREELLVERFLTLTVESSGAQRGFFVVLRNDELLLRGRYLGEEGEFTLFPLDGGREKEERLVRSINLSIGVLRYVKRSGQRVVLDDAAARGDFVNDPYFRSEQVRSVLCEPLDDTGFGRAMIYLENRVVPSLFTRERIEIVELLSRQAGTALQNARLYEESRLLNRNLQEEILRRSRVEEGLRKTKQELEDLNRDLEKRVRERTRDVLESKRELEKSYRELQETQEKLIESEKLAGLGSLVAGIAHEVNTPLGVAVTAASFLTEQLNSGKAEPEALKETVDLLERNLKRAGELIGSFKKVAVDQAGEQVREFMLDSYIRDVLISLQPLIRKSGVSVTSHIPEGIRVLGKPGALSQIMGNLVQNSLIHGFAEGEEGNIRIQGRMEGDDVLLSYADDGRGMEADTVKKVFNPFFTTRRGSGGSGLGMNIVYNLVVKGLSGEITCESEPGKGVRFMIRFPRKSPAASSST